MKPTVIWLASLLVLCLSSVSMAAASVGPPRPPSGSRWLWSWLPKSAAVDLRSTDFQKKNNLPLVRLKKDHMDVLRLKKDAGNGKRDMDVLRLKKSIIKERNNIDRTSQDNAAARRLMRARQRSAWRTRRSGNDHAGAMNMDMLRLRRALGTQGPMDMLRL